jgi:hypothetical protein
LRVKTRLEVLRPGDESEIVRAGIIERGSGANLAIAIAAQAKTKTSG